MNTDAVEKLVPKRIFIVPYRNRREQKFFFSNQMNFILEKDDDYEIFFVHQCDSRNFNRGATKNIGFLAMKEKYPNDYQDITFIFNDVDTLPFHRIFDYQTVHGVVTHYYGFDTALGGIVVMKGFDFELINGYPNYWGWGMEDACLQKRCLNHGLKINRSHFYKIGSPEILQLFDGVSRLVSRRDPERMKNDNGVDGVSTIQNLMYSVDSESLNPNDNVFVVSNSRIMVINVTNFTTLVRFDEDDFHKYDLREPVRNVMFPNQNTQYVDNTVVTTDDWKNIPYYPTLEEKIQNDDALEINQYIQNIRLQNTGSVPPQNKSFGPFIKNQNINTQSAKYIFSKENSKNYPKPRSTTSANIKLGGVKK
jgi:N-terminal region of glycosyl transferase group 7/N-terminal domain of galactosyltransferase